MENNRQIPWPRLFAEGAAIVASILLAFWIDAWWDERTNRTQETALLRDLQTELLAFQQAFENNDIYVAAIRESVRKLLEASASTDPALSESELDVLLSDITWYVDSTELDLAVLESAASGGQLGNIANNDIRRKLGTWFIKLRSVKTAVDDDFDFYRNRLMPFLYRNASILQIANIEASRPGFPELYFPNLYPQVSSTMSHRPLLDNLEFQNILMDRINTLTNILEWRRSDIQGDLTEILALLENELEGRQDF